MTQVSDTRATEKISTNVVSITQRRQQMQKRNVIAKGELRIGKSVQLKIGYIYIYIYFHIDIDIDLS